MPKLIFDIETVGVEFNEMDEFSKESLLRFAKSPDEEEDVKNNLGFSPLTGSIVAIGILNPDTEKGAVYYQAPESGLEKIEEDGVHYIPLSEKDILKNFWDTAQFYDQFITFNGRAFDAPFMITRSAIHKVKPTKNLMGNRYSDNSHIDLLDRLTFFGAVRRKMNLHMWCQAFGITSPKDKGITGDDVGRLFKEKKYLDIAKYCFDDLKATGELFNYWEKYINI